MDEVRLQDWNACRQAAAAVSAWIGETGYGNVILNIANEQNSAFYDKVPWSKVRNPEDILELCRIAHEHNDSLLVGAGGYDHHKNEMLGRSPEVDVLLFDTNGPENSGELYERFQAAGVREKPMVNVEIFGGWTKEFMPPGVFPEAGKQAHLREIDAALRHDGLHVFFHSNTWCQGPSVGYPVRYDL